MENEIILSIAIITRDRAEQLKAALKSCLACELPKRTEFVVIDNASTDETEEVVKEILGNSGYTYYYEKMDENIGAGKGRNYAFEKSKGEYVFSLDDDAFIDSKENKDFFIKAIDILNENNNIVSLTTQIYDTAWKHNRIVDEKIKIVDGIYRLNYICEGSNFLRRNFFDSPPYFPNVYGYEALPIVLKIFDSKMDNCFCDSLLAIHNPKIDKWDYLNEKNHGLLLKGLALPYAIKKMMYPKVFLPFLALAHSMRKRKYVKTISNAKETIKQIVNDTIRQYPINYKIKIRTVMRMLKDFGLSAF